ncbi:peroxisomal N(1)-acetyl-spermine/spermidine oxidase-like [Macrobrachium nipponense]|uniref:peroxisomal N(1)-acetyl-spermine/spermidine oxidase-like n=1 Tax=Macrobrachium nipponense TaxID=159736 RepID=UPI0030C7B03E
MGLGLPSLFLLPLLLGVLFWIAEAAHPCDVITGGYSNWIGSAINKDVVIVGGGISGLSAMKKLLEEQVTNAVILEAQDYLGGRVKTYRQGSILVEDGAEWIHGGSRNPLYQLANSLGMLTQPLADSAYDWRVKTSTGTQASEAGYNVAEQVFFECEKGSVIQNYYNTAIGQCYKDKFGSFYNNGKTLAGEKSAWLHYLNMFVLRDVGLNDWMKESGRDFDQFTSFGGEDKLNQWSQGYDALTNNLKSSIPQDKIKLSTPVCKIFWESDPNGKALVVTSTKEAYLTDYVLVTASIGHLQERHLQLFDPPLPASYQNNLNRLELGLADKIHLGWSSPWWKALNPKPLDMQVIFKVFDLPTEESWLYGVMEVMGVHQQLNLLQAFVNGDYAQKMENLSDDDVKRHILKFLRRVTGQTVPEPTFFRRSQWGKNVWVRGSYSSYITVSGDQAGLKSRNPLSVPITNSYGNKVIHWAGEHTNGTRYGTVDGALGSGTRAAVRIINDM